MKELEAKQRSFDSTIMRPKTTIIAAIVFLVSLLPSFTFGQHQKAEKATDSTVYVQTAASYKASALKRFLLGNHYRELWTVKIEVPVFRPAKLKGGLKAVQKGGGMQTLSLRLENDLGRQFVVRSVAKDPSSILPAALKGTLAADVLADQISASHPFGAFVIPHLADAAGIYHTDPKLVYVVKHKNLGQWGDEFDGVLALFEERPKGDMSFSDNFGGATKIKGTPDIMEKIYDDSENQVDQRFLLRNRLFDMIIGDWDRHEDQWRWTVAKTEDGQRYRCIPRDRDQAFFSMDGVLPWFASRKWALRKMQLFEENIRDVPGFNFNARYLDHRFLNELEWKDWKEIVDTLQHAITPEVIDSALATWPKAIYEMSGPEISRKLLGRAVHLRQIARKHYLHLAKEVDVVGSNHDEEFEVKRKKKGGVEVKMYRLDKKGKKKQKVYERDFKPKHTKEIRLYGLGGEDEFDIKGEGKPKIKIRIIGGAGEDQLKDKTEHKGLCRKTIYYDTKEGNEIDKGNGTKPKLRNDSLHNSYNYKAYKYNTLAPATFFGFNPDDGIFLGGGLFIRNHGFRKDPAKTTQILTASYAFRSNAFKARYSGKWHQIIGRKTDLHIVAGANYPKFVENYFGMGNETEEVREESSYHWVPLQQLYLHPSLVTKIGKSSKIVAGLRYDGFAPERELADGDADIFINDTISGLTAADFDEDRLAGIGLEYHYDRTDGHAMPTKGVRFNLLADGRFNLSKDQEFATVESNLSFYISIKKPTLITFATRFGGELSFGTMPFYMRPAIGGLSNFRGTRRSRYRGDRTAYNNTEIRIRLAQFRTYLFPLQLGVHGLVDNGRVWFDGETSNQWHQAFGGGIWFSPMELAVITATYSVSKVDQVILIQFGFLF